LCLKFGHQYAKEIQRRRPRPDDTWFLDEVFITIGARHHYLWQAVDQDGDVLDILVQKRCDKQAAKRFFRKLLKGLRYAPRRIVTDKLRSFSAARKEVLPDVIHDNDKW
jgi:putative transposase